MIRERQGTWTASVIFSDIFLSGLSFFIAYMEKRSLPGALASLGSIQEYGWLFLLYLILLVGALYLSGFYTFSRTQTIPDIVLGIVKSTGTAFAVVILILFFVKEQSISRLFLGLFCLNNALLLIIAKIGFRLVLAKMQESGYSTINALVIGSEFPAKRLIEMLTGHRELGYRVLGCLDPDSDRTGSQVAGIDILGEPGQLEHFLETMNIDEVFVAMPMYKVGQIDRIMYLCEEVGVRFSILTDWLKPNIAKTVVRNFLDRPVITYTATPTAVGQLLVKAVLDRLISAIIMFILLPFYLLIAVIIKLTSKGPAIYEQERAGLNGRSFQMLKFRTMVEGADQMLDELQAQNEMDGPVFKMKNDPRVTAIGRWLRRTSLDELPQLFNVLRGDMSLVGPRPPIPKEVEKYERWQRRRLSMKPGITCYWQIAGRNEVSFEDWMSLDLKYIDSWSLGLDFVILLKTIPVVLSGRGAS